MKVLGLFSGAAGIELGFESAGYEIIGLCENDHAAVQVLQYRYPHAPIFKDVRGVSRRGVLEVCGHLPDVVVGGFPCQGISLAGRGEGLADHRSALWSEMRRVVDECRPRWVFAENVSALRTRGADRVLADLEGIGYSCWPFVVGASDIGAPHERKRVWIVAHSGEVPRRVQPGRRSGESRSGAPVAGDDGEQESVADADGQGQLQQGWAERPVRRWAGDSGSEVADAHGAGRSQQQQPLAAASQLSSAQCRGWWEVEPEVGRVVDGLPYRLVQLALMGNAVVPAIPAIFAKIIKGIDEFL